MADAALILAAGGGARMQGAVADKTLEPLAGKPALLHSLEAFARSGAVGLFCIVFKDEAQRERIERLLRATRHAASCCYAKGGAERQDSALSGLLALPQSIERVYIHDAARPLLGPRALLALRERLLETGAACLARRASDTIKRVHGDPARPEAIEDLDRSLLWAMETPQAFERALILEAYQKAKAERASVTDDAAAAALLGKTVSLVENPDPNPKLTRPEDFLFAEAALREITRD